jgi:hypothetical protein
VALEYGEFVVRRVAAGVERESLEVLVLVRVVVRADRRASDKMGERRVAGRLGLGLGEVEPCFMILVRELRRM